MCIIDRGKSLQVHRFHGPPCFGNQSLRQSQGLVEMALFPIAQNPDCLLYTSVGTVQRIAHFQAQAVARAQAAGLGACVKEGFKPFDAFPGLSLIHI